MASLAIGAETVVMERGRRAADKLSVMSVEDNGRLRPIFMRRPVDMKDAQKSVDLKCEWT